MRQRLIQTGSLLFDYLVLWAALNVALILVLPFLAVVTGVHRYATTATDQKSLSDLVRPIRETPRQLVALTLFVLLVLLAAYANLFVLRPSGVIGIGITGVTYVLLGIVALVFLHAPTILNEMHVTVRDTLYNAIMMSLASPLSTLSRLGLLALTIYTAWIALPLFLFGFPIAIVLIARSSHYTLTQLKEKMT